jgi:HD superfamily phosphohydrolase
MGEQADVFNVDRYKEVNLIADPLYGYIPFTKARHGEKTEEALIDSRWVQRLRRIHQLQSAFWVFPSGEHTRFQHALGTMHLAGECACHLYDSLVDVCNKAGEEIIPSQQLFEETARVAGLLHDIGHGPFGHFFDENYLADFGITHEDISQQIIKDELSDIIKDIRRSPSSKFESTERLDPRQIAYVIKKRGQDDSQFLWLKLLKKLLTGLYTADNLDFVRRDAYMSGVSVGPIDVERLKYYSQYCYRLGEGPGLALHLNGVSALEMFLYVRSYMFTNVYNHRRVRAIELEMKDGDLFKRTTSELFPYGDPRSNLTKYCEFDEWQAMSEINRWATEPSVGEKQRKLARRWCPIIQRRPQLASHRRVA